MEAYRVAVMGLHRYSHVSMHARLFSILTEVQCVVVASTSSDVSVKVTLNTTETSNRVIVE